jgi:putative endonuclease
MIPPPAGGGAKTREAYIYLLESRNDQTFYVGWTTDVLRRLAEHNHNFSGFTRRKTPWRLIGFEVVGSAAEAKARERALKRNPHILQLFKKRMLSRSAFSGPRQVVG